MEEIKFPILFLKLFSSNNLNITKHTANVNLTEQKGKGIIKIEIYRFFICYFIFFLTLDYKQGGEKTLKKRNFLLCYFQCFIYYF